MQDMIYIKGQVQTVNAHLHRSYGGRVHGQRKLTRTWIRWYLGSCCLNSHYLGQKKRRKKRKEKEKKTLSGPKKKKKGKEKKKKKV